MKPEDIRVDVQNDRLTVSGETESSSTETREGGNYVVRERSYGSFSRTLVLPPGTKVCDSSRQWHTEHLTYGGFSSFQPEDIKANLDNGVLRITFPRAASDQLPKRITIT